MTSLAVFTNHSSLQQEAKNLAERLVLPCIFEPTTTYEFLLMLTPNHLSLQKNGEKSNPLCIDFLSGKLQYRLQQATTRNETLVRALGLKKNTRPSIVDATAGLGRDSFLLATLGFEVTSLERSPIIFELLKDGMMRAEQHAEIAPIAAKIHLVQSNAIAWLKLNAPVDIIYLDPMFPERKKSALTKKDMRYFHSIVGDDEDADQLLEAALACATQRVVVKRPRLAAALQNKRQPSFSLSGSSSRFDIYLNGVTA